MTEPELLSEERFRKDLQDSLAREKSSIAAFKKLIAAFQTTLYEQFDQGADVVKLVHARALFHDVILQHAWQQFMPEELNACLLAVGGYGRGELHPASDIDLMILLAETEDDSTKAALESLLMFLWDIGLEVGHSVRTLEECVREADADITVATNIMEARLLSGSSELFTAMQQQTGPEHIWPSDKFFAAKLAEQQSRHSKFDDSAYNLEPNIKTNPGGLRDIQMIGWVAKRYFGATRLSDLVKHNFLTEDEYRTLKQCEKLLWRIRFALHRLTNRHEDRLLFDHQRKLAREFGYDNPEGNQAIEAFMQHYYRTVIELNQLNEMLLQLFREAIVLAHEDHTPVPINPRFHSVNDYLEVTHTQVFIQYPLAMLELFTIMAQVEGLRGVRASTIRLIREHRHLIDRNFRRDRKAHELFLSLFRNQHGLTHELRRMNRYGVLARYIPEFDNVVGRMQYDLFHVYTVDEHSLFVVRNLRRFTIPEHHDEFPLCSDIISSLSLPETVYIAALFHDIAKGRDGDHAELGAIDAENFCKRHRMSSYETNLISWLVRNHLLMSMTAQRKDIDDPDVVQEFAQQVADASRLDCLYLLTVADSRATNPDRWNDFKDSLLKQLYSSTRKALIRGLDNPQDHNEVIQLKQEYASKKLRDMGYSTEDIHRLWMTLSVEYFVHASPDEIIWQSRIVLDAQAVEKPVIKIRRQTNRGGTEIFVCTEDRENVFAITSILLAQQGLKVLSARIQSSGNSCTMNSFIVHEQDDSYIETDTRIREITECLSYGLRHPESVSSSIRTHVTRQIKHFTKPPELFFSQDHTHHLTRMRLIATDKPGLLADMGQVFIKHGIKIHSAKISTIGADVEDIFMISDKQDLPITDEALLQNLESQIIQRLS
ncbi:MAG: [protein-PII] uridylyltransferase [Chromatiales bacterium]|jgi:[protein-PII] uridylyltransferase